MDIGDFTALEITICTAIVAVVTAFWAGKFGANRAMRQAVDDYRQALDAKVAQCALCDAEFRRRIELLETRIEELSNDKMQLSELNMRLLGENSELKERIAHLEVEMRILQNKLLTAAQ